MGAELFVQVLQTVAIVLCSLEGVGEDRVGGVDLDSHVVSKCLLVCYADVAVKERCVC